MKKIILILGVIILGMNLIMASDKAATQEPSSEEPKTAPIVNSPEGESVTEISTTEETEEWEIIWPEYQEWSVARIQGKLKMNGLPVSPTLKIYMKRDSLIDISLRAPFVGEAGRLILMPDSVTLINRMNKTYAGGSFRKDISAALPIGLLDVQDLLLGRFFLPGFNVMEADLDELVDIYYGDNGLFNIIPKGAAEIQGVRYGFTTDGYFKPLMLMILPDVSQQRGEESEEGVEVDVVYSWLKNGYDMGVTYTDGKRTFEATLELKDPEWDGEGPKEPDLKKFKQLTMGDFVRNALR